MTNVLATVATGAIAIYGLLHLLLHFTHDGREPPLAPTPIPFFGHMIGLLKKKSKYYVELRDNYNLPIYTLRLPGARLYVINSTSLIPSVQKQFKTLAFPPLEAKFAKSICGSSKTAKDILDTNVNGDEGFWGYSITFYKMIHTPFHEITLATTDSVYGPQNPFRDSAIEESFWKFQPGIMILMIELFPSVLAKESFEARELMTKAFIRYFQEGGYREGSALVNARYEHSREHKIPLEDIARYEVGGAIGILTNTSPASFWMAYHLYSDEVVLGECRQELNKVITDTPTTSNGKTVNIRTLDMSKVKVSCPILLSTFQEVLRTHTVGISTRLVMEDHLLDGKYLLKKGGTVMIPDPVQHTNTGSWGSNVESFDHRRFLPKTRTHNLMAFRGFGGGTRLCPGRHFASTEILAFTALMILLYNVTPVGEKWVCPTTDRAGLWEVTPVPDEDISVEVTPRAGEDAAMKWRILVTDSDKGLQLSAEDF